MNNENNKAGNAGENTGNEQGSNAPVINTPSNQKSSETKTNEQANNLEFGEEIRKMLPTAGTLKLDADQKAALYAPVIDSDVYIKPDGLIYLSWIKYAGRLTKAFGGTGWTMLPQGMPKGFNNNIIWGFHLVIEGVYCGFAIGEQQYFANGRMSYGEACEGAKSNALMRLCKALGIGLELWDKEFIARWLDAYAVKTWDASANQGQGKYKWSLKPNAFGNVTPPNVSTPKPVNAENAPVVPPVAETKAPVKETKATVKKGKNGKLAENTEFLAKTKVPLEEIKEEEITGEVTITQSAKYTELHAAVTSSDTTGKLKMAYDKVKTAHSKNEVTEEEKETLRKIANQLFVKLASGK